MIFFFQPAIEKNYLNAIKFCSLVEDGVDNEIAIFEEICSKNYFLYFLFLVITYIAFSSYYKMWFYHLKKYRSQQPFALEQKQRKFLNCWSIPNKLKDTRFSICITVFFFAWVMKNLLIQGTFDVLIKTGISIENEK